MGKREKVILSWSGGKDSALALEALRGTDRYEVVGLLATVSDAYGRVSHHGVRSELLEEQAAAVGLPLETVGLPTDDGGRCTNDLYEAAMAEAMGRQRAAGVRTVAFGDIYLADIRAYRERQVARAGMQAVFPLWQRRTPELSEAFVRSGYRATVVCVDQRKLDVSFAGRPLDRSLLEDLPDGIDACGEKGEFHSFVYDGPGFARPVGLRVGRTLARDGRYFTDLLPV